MAKHEFEERKYQVTSKRNPYMRSEITSTVRKSQSEAEEREALTESFKMFQTREGFRRNEVRDLTSDDLDIKRIY
ncbi:MAG: hypothetical protein PUC50_02170 [Bacteroidales bacterium]|nr:hypothetical protein [Bacteroidales bacterium]